MQGKAEQLGMTLLPKKTVFFKGQLYARGGGGQPAQLRQKSFITTDLLRWLP